MLPRERGKKPSLKCVYWRVKAGRPSKIFLLLLCYVVVVVMADLALAVVARNANAKVTDKHAAKVANFPRKKRSSSFPCKYGRKAELFDFGRNKWIEMD